MPSQQPPTTSQPSRRVRRPSSRPPGRSDTRRPGAGPRPTGHGGPRPTGGSVRRSVARQAHEAQPPYWFAERLLLVLSGRRPLHTLMRHTRPSTYERLAQLVPLAPLHPGPGDRSTPVVLEARGRQPCSGVIEAFARIKSGNRQRAMAFRLELDTPAQWRCAAIELDGEDEPR
ncbi:hypothetical protein E0L36_00785 [Streptomyces sp. AJS327]|uniref:Rv3235 family protein n=1 Tax=Streptomyces sp. AJS327 TaxID=2545265 RepID=UPI0015E020DA|nr:Rv3235 family protein [Streptomyces sp. AJS327]MBA0049498.1 hypothetical protein [Streptomyces sp. AJS327]